jgi:nucleoid DNA-binding protein
MAALHTVKPTYETNFVILPRVVFDGATDLTPNATTILGYLMSRPPEWNINRKVIADKLRISFYAVNQAFRLLQKLGIAAYTRNSKGYTDWIISFPKEILATLVKSPQIDTPLMQAPPLEPQPALITKDVLTSNKNTTNTPTIEKIEPQKKEVVVISKPVKEQTAATPAPITNSLPLPAQLNDSEKQSALKALSKISDYALQVAILSIYTKALTDNIIRTSKIGYLIRLVERALNNTLDIPATAVSEEQKKIDRTAKIRDIVQRNQTSILEKLKLQGWVSLKGFGVFTRDELKPFLVAL